MVEERPHVPYEVRSFDLPTLQLRDEIEAGHLVVDGTEVIDGRELIRLSDHGLVEQTVFVDPETYLPVEQHYDRRGPDEGVIRFEYLPRTEENLELLTPPVPDGYRETDERPSDD